MEKNKQLPKYDFTQAEIKAANAGDSEALTNQYVEARGGYHGSEEGQESAESVDQDLMLEDSASVHAGNVKNGVAEMYEDAYAENERVGEVSGHIAVEGAEGTVQEIPVHIQKPAD